MKELFYHSCYMEINDRLVPMLDYIDSVLHTSIVQYTLLISYIAR